jgi:hypothetical protein
MAKWALALRLRAAPTDATIEDAFNRGAILRTHALRPTWHFVSPADIRWMLQLSGPRIRVQMAGRHRDLEVDAALVKRARRIVTKALEGGAHLNRTEISEALRRQRVLASGERLAHLVMLLELEGLLCSGPRVGKQFTYALLEKRVPAAKPRTRDEAIAELAHRYFASRGPATAHDFAWWSGLTLRDARAGMASLGAEYAEDTYAGVHYTFPTHAAKIRPARSHFLMPDYDEYGIAYVDRRNLYADPSFPVRASSLATRTYNRSIVSARQIIGSWRRAVSGAGVEIEAVAFSPLTPQQERDLTADAKMFAAFLGLGSPLAARLVVRLVGSPSQLSRREVAS